MRLCVLTCFAALAGCGDDDCCKVSGDAAVDANDGYVEVARRPVLVNRDLDMLFVIHDSNGMLDKQTNLKGAFPVLVNTLNAMEGGLPNLHIGVVSSDLGTKGADDAAPGPSVGSGPGSCAGTGKSGNLQTNNTTLVSGAFISDIANTDGTRTTNYFGSLADAFGAFASLGANGCAIEQPLHAARAALNNTPANAGFLRANAHLALVVFGDEDDCSMAHSTLLGSDTATLGPLSSFRCTRFGITCDEGGATSDEMNVPGVKGQCHSNEASPYLTPITEYVSFFQGLKADPSDVLFSAIVGPPTPVEVELRPPVGGGAPIPQLAHSCTYDASTPQEVADPAVRIVQIANMFARHTIGSVCDVDLAASLVDLGVQLRLMIGDACLTREIAQPPDCKVTEEAGGTSTPLPACDNGASSTNKPCYELVADPVACTAGSHTKLVVQRDQAPVADRVVVASCKL